MHRYGLYQEDHHRLLGAEGAHAGRSQYGPTEPDTLAHMYGLLHMVGAIGFVILVTSSVMVHDTTETEVGLITGMSFLIFCLLGYLTGHYVWVLPPLRCIVMLWNPFMHEPQFMAKLQRSVDTWLVRQRSSKRGNTLNTQSETPAPAYICDSDGSDQKVGYSVSAVSVATASVSVEQEQAVVANTYTTSSTTSGVRRRERSRGKSSRGRVVSTSASAVSALTTSTFDKVVTADKQPYIDSSSPSARKDSSGSGSGGGTLRGTDGPLIAPSLPAELCLADLQTTLVIPCAEAAVADEALDTFFLRLARSEPKRYCKVTGHFLVMSELIALLTPCVAVGIHWITALCTDATPTAVMLDLLGSFLTECAWEMNPACDLTRHCIMRGS